LFSAYISLVQSFFTVCNALHEVTFLTFTLRLLLHLHQSITRHHTGEHLSHLHMIWYWPQDGTPAFTINHTSSDR